MPAATSLGITYAVPTDPPDIAGITQSMAASISQLLSDSGWTNLPITAGVSTNTLTPAYRIKAGVIYFRGDIKGTSAFQPATTYNLVAVGGMPASARPVGNVLKAVVSSGAVGGLIAFNNDGSIVMLVGPTAMSNVQLGDASFLLG